MNSMDDPPASAARRAAAMLRQRVLSGELPPATPLRESVLIGELQISRNTLREAFQQLSVEGLTEQRLYKGTVVRRVSLEEVRDIFVSRRTFELRAVEESASAPALRLQALRAACWRTEHAARRQAWSEVGTASLQFHQAVVGLLGSRKLDSFFEILAALLRLAFSEVLNEASFQAPWVPRDREICELICARRVAEGVAAMEKYLADSEQILLDVLHATRAFGPGGDRRGASAPELALDA
jgi:DNA-binding GntR family transcriptional regulator